MFDYKGYTEEKLLDLCDEEKVDRGKAKWLHWQCEVYSQGINFRDYGFYPKKLPLNIMSDHGVGTDGEFIIPDFETDSSTPVMFVYNAIKQKNFKKICKKPCYVVLHPYMWYKKRKKIKQLENAKGTIAFPAHSIPVEDVIFDIKKYIEHLKSLPEDMQPVCVCLHMHDIAKGQHKIFLENGIPVYTAGNAGDIKFAERYYEILKHFKYATSNAIGSYLYFAVELGLPFSLIDNKEVITFNRENKYAPKGEYTAHSSIFEKTEKLFGGINKTITKEQKELTESVLGINCGISRLKFSFLLYKAYFIRRMEKLFKK